MSAEPDSVPPTDSRVRSDLVVAETKEVCHDHEEKLRAQTSLSDLRDKAIKRFGAKKYIPLPVLRENATARKPSKPRNYRRPPADRITSGSIAYRGSYSPYSPDPRRHAPHRPIHRTNLSYEWVILTADVDRVAESNEIDPPTIGSTCPSRLPESKKEPQTVDIVNIQSRSGGVRRRCIPKASLSALLAVQNR